MSANPTSGYEALVNGALRFAGVDQGIDFTGRGTIHALADGVIERLQREGSGWPGRGALLVYRITSGPAAGKRVYVAEDYAVASGLRVGSKVSRGQLIGRVDSSYPGIEVGWAGPGGSPIAPLNPNPHSPKAAGRDFNNFVRGLGGAGAGPSLGASTAGDGSPSFNPGAAGCATSLLALILAIGAFFAMAYGTGVTLWP
jgi:hypothetical protein